MSDSSDSEAEAFTAVEDLDLGEADVLDLDSELLEGARGEETEPMTTKWSVYAHMTTTVLEPLFKPIDFEVDVEARTARLSVPGVIEGSGEPIRNPVTGNIHRARIDLPHGFEYEIAEIGSGTTKTMGGIELNLESTYGRFAELHLSNTGVVRQSA